MTKTVCDICGEEMPSTAIFVKDIKNFNFSMSSYGRIWDICTDCRESLNRWITMRKQKGEIRNDTSRNGDQDKRIRETD